MNQLRLDVAGMICAGCEHAISNAIARQDGIRRVEANSTKGTVIVDFDSTVAVPDSIKQRVALAGYEVVGEEIGT